MEIILFIAVIICAAGWYMRYISCLALLYYIGEKGYEFPNDEDVKECTAYVTKRLIKGR
ncbi:hypothetical protein FMM74_016175 [Lachnospiraceae bacterium MD308]|nr:hypothetical protein [Lachnospiraceae bacterium MD308]